MAAPDRNVAAQKSSETKTFYFPVLPGDSVDLARQSVPSLCPPSSRQDGLHDVLSLRGLTGSGARGTLIAKGPRAQQASHWAEK